MDKVKFLKPVEIDGTLKLQGVVLSREILLALIDSIDMITFTIVDTTYTAMPGMTWMEWAQSEFNDNSRVKVDPHTNTLEWAYHFGHVYVTGMRESNSQQDVPSSGELPIIDGGIYEYTDYMGASKDY